MVPQPWPDTDREIHSLFPLAIAQVQLRPDPIDSALMLQQVLALRGGHHSNPDPDCAWTGDLHGVWQVHQRPEFAWLLAQVSLEAQRYLLALGFDLERVRLHLQRCWPVVAEPGQGVGRHHHPNAHLSAVYYLNGDGSGRSGCLRLFDRRRSNELVPGLAVGHDGPITVGHPLNAGWYDLAPRAGLLVLFPASVDHAVFASEDNDDLRLSISFDLVLTAPASGPDRPQPPEYLAPHPSQWLELLPDGAPRSGKIVQ